MSDNCPICNTPWTETQLITNSIKHCTKCNEKASSIMAKHKKSEKVKYPKIDIAKYALKLPEGLTIDRGRIRQMYPKTDPNCPIAQKEEVRSIREEMDYLYEKWQESKL
jgi:hypothetical protein